MEAGKSIETVLKLVMIASIIVIESLRSVLLDNHIEIKLKLSETPYATTWTGEEQTFF